MSAALISLLVSAGASVWVFTKLQNRTGYGNNKDAMIGAAVVFAVGFVVLFTIVHLLLHN